MWFFGRKKKKQAPSPETSSPHTILGRVSTLLRANIHAALDEASDPEKMLDQLVRDFTAGVADAREAVSETITNVRLIEAKQSQDRMEIEQWSGKAEMAAARARQLAKKGDEAGARQAEQLAQKALTRQINAEQRVASREETIAQNNAMVESLKQGLEQMGEKLEELKENRSELLTRHHLAQTQQHVVGAVSQINSADPTSAMSQLEEKVLRSEASAQAQLEVASSSLESQFETLESASTSVEASHRLEALLGRPVTSTNQIEKG